jgi:hypothetical protein
MSRRPITPGARSIPHDVWLLLVAEKPSIESRYPLGSQWVVYGELRVTVVGYYPTKYSGWQVVFSFGDDQRMRLYPSDHHKRLEVAPARASVANEQEQRP